MKISICGKGGCGKSTLTTLLANSYAKDEKRVLVIDGDESNFGLAQLLGKEQPKEYIDEMGGKMNMMPALANAPMSIPNFFEKPWTMDTLPEGASPAPGEAKVMSIGKIHTDNEGCACIFNAVLMQLIDNLHLNKNDVTLIDMEAGIEHFGRGTDNAVDAVIMVIDPTAESIKLTNKVNEITQHMEKPLRYVLNKVEPGDANIIREQLDKPEFIIAEISSNKDIRKAGFDGSQLTLQLDETTLIKNELAKIQN